MTRIATLLRFYNTGTFHGRNEWHCGKTRQAFALCIRGAPAATIYMPKAFHNRTTACGLRREHSLDVCAAAGPTPAFCRMDVSGTWAWLPIFMPSSRFFLRELPATFVLPRHRATARTLNAAFCLPTHPVLPTWRLLLITASYQTASALLSFQYPLLSYQT